MMRWLKMGRENSDPGPDAMDGEARFREALAVAHDQLEEYVRRIEALEARCAEKEAQIGELALVNRRLEQEMADRSRLGQAMSGLLDQVGVVADSVGQIVGTSASTDALIGEGRKMLRDALSSMEHVQVSIEDSLALVEGFGKRSREIEEVIKEIGDIAYFTRMLSLNAAIEAARAGDQGKGFGFLADEVQNLAKSISRSTSDITELLALIGRESSATAESVVRSSRQVADAAQRVARLDDALARIREELHGMDADLQDSHLMSLRVTEEREQALAALSALAEQAASEVASDSWPEPS